MVADRENTEQGGGLKCSGLKPVLSSIVTNDLSTVTGRLRNESDANTSSSRANWNFMAMKKTGEQKH